MEMILFLESCFLLPFDSLSKGLKMIVSMCILLKYKICMFVHVSSQITVLSELESWRETSIFMNLLEVE